MLGKWFQGHENGQQSLVVHFWILLRDQEWSSSSGSLADLEAWGFSVTGTRAVSVDSIRVWGLQSLQLRRSVKEDREG